MSLKQSVLRKESLKSTGLSENKLVSLQLLISFKMLNRDFLRGKYDMLCFLNFIWPQNFVLFIFGNTLQERLTRNKPWKHCSKFSKKR